MVRRLLLTVSTTLWLWGIYVVYSAIVTPWLQPVEVTNRLQQSLDPQQESSREQPSEISALITTYLPDAPWVEQCPYKLCVGDGVYLFTQAWKHQDSTDKVQFTKFALLIQRGQNSKQPERPFTIVSDGAEIQFSSPFGVANPRTGRIVAGNLTGPVSLKGAHGLWLEGRNFSFSEKRRPQLISDSEVKFGYGLHSGQGLGVEIEFLSGDAAPSKDLPNVTGIRTIRVRRDVRLELVRESSKAGLPARGHSVKETLLIDCLQDMIFEMASLQLSLKERVHLVQPTLSGHSNRLDCELLVLQLRSAEAASNSPTSPVKPGRYSHWFPKRLELSRLTARGDEQHRVTLKSLEKQFHGQMSELLYDVTTRTFVLRDQSRGVHLTLREQVFDSAELRVQLDAQQRLHKIHAPYEGVVRAVSEKGDQFRAEWKQEMFNQPVETLPGQDRLELVGQAKLSQERAGYNLQGNRIFVWYTRPDQRVTKAELAKPDQPATEARSRPKPGSSSKDLRIHRLVAEDQVQFDAPEFHGNTTALDLLFAESPQPLVRTDKAKPRKPTPSGAAAKPSDPPVQDASSSKTPLTENSPKTRYRERPAIQAGRIQVQLLRYQNDIQVAGVTALKQVVLHQAKSDGQPPSEAHAERMVMTQNGEQDQTLELHGGPAELRDGSSLIRGPVIFIWGNKNRAEVRGQGEFQTLVKSSLDGKSLPTPQTLTVTWKEKLTFDGQRVSFFEAVRAKLEESWMTCGTMHVQLSERISFLDQQKARSHAQLEIDELECLYPVTFEQSTLEQGQLKIRAWGEAARFRMDRRTGKTIADGPGQIRMWQARGTRSPSDKSPALLTVSHPSSTDATRWDHVQVDFEGNMDGNFNQQFTTFNDKVFVLYGIVDEALDVIPRDELPKEGGTMECQTLQVTQHSAIGGGKYIHLRGQGNVRLESPAFEGRADEIHHDQSKKMYLLKSLGKDNTATLWYTPAGKGERLGVNARTFQFIVDGDSLKQVRSTNATGAGTGQ